jgi:hypothetical protein
MVDLQQDPVPGLTDDEQELLSSLQAQWEAKLPRNVLRAAYYDGKRALAHSILMSLPPAFRHVATVLGWPAKAVDTLNTRCHLERFVLPGSDVTDLGVDEIWDDNNLSSDIPQAQLSSLIHAVAWLVTTEGDPDEGEPAAVITIKDALRGSGLWNGRRRKLDAFLSILEVDELRPDHITSQVLYLPEGNVIME